MKKPSLVQLEHLERKHKTLDDALGQLVSHAHLTPEEYQLSREIKKRKLRAKDGITAIRQQFTGS